MNLSIWSILGKEALLDIAVPVRFRGYRPITPVGYGVHGAVDIGPVRRNVSLIAGLDYLRVGEAELVIIGYVTRSAQDTRPFQLNCKLQYQ